MSCDCERPEAYKVKIRRAAKVHRCCECGGEIVRGQCYEDVSGVFDHSPFRERTCLPCVELRRIVEMASNSCNCVPHSGLMAHISEQFCGTKRDESLHVAGYDWTVLASLAQDDASAAAVGHAAGHLYAGLLLEYDTRQVQLRSFRLGRPITLLQARAEMEASQ